VFETFPLPEPATPIEAAGVKWYSCRQSLLAAANEGLTQTYNRFHDPAEQLIGLSRLRDLHVELDYAVAGAYDWSDIDLGHGFHETQQGVRFTISPPARQEILDRLLALNHQRYAEEVAQGLHENVSAKATAAATGKKSRKSSNGSPLLEGV
jgi:hypothetical protein